MKTIGFFILISVSSSHQLTGPKEVRGEVGGSVTVECRYDQTYKEHKKQWCKGRVFLTCSVIVSTDNPQKQGVSLTDNKTRGIFSVTMDNLRKSDEGLYWCEIEVLLLNKGDSVKLEVFEGSHQLTGPKEVRGEVGGSVTVECRYDQTYKEHKKQWCKGRVFLTCSVIVSTDNPQKQGVSLTDNKTRGIFSVTMDNLRKSDEGLYWCEIEVLLLNIRDSVKLEVFEAPAWGSTMGPTSSTAGTTQPPVTTALTMSSSTISSPSEEGSQSNHMDSWQIILTVVILIIFLLLTAAVLLYAKLKQQKKSVTVEQNTPGVGSPASSVMEDTNVIYSTVKKVPKANLESTYVNLQDLQSQRTAKDQSPSDFVEYSTVLFRS